MLLQAAQEGGSDRNKERMDTHFRASSSRVEELESEVELLRSTEEARIQEYAALGLFLPAKVLYS